VGVRKQQSSADSIFIQCAETLKSTSIWG